MMNYWRYGNGPTVVLQHGFLGGSRCWIPQILELGKMFDIIAPDLPGFARSAYEPIPDSIESYTTSVLNLLNFLGVNQFSFIGHSLGGMIAQQIAVMHADRLNKVVLYGTAPEGNMPTRFETFEATAARFENVGSMAGEKVIESWFVEGRESPFFDLCLQDGKEVNISAAVSIMRSLSRWSLRNHLEKITSPCLIICGDQDKATTPTIAYELWHNIPNAQLCIVPQCSHMVHLEMPDVFNRILVNFLTKVIQ